MCILIELSEVNFKMSPVDEKPRRRYSKSSKYDPILDRFIVSRDRLVIVEVAERNANYIRTQLKKRIDARRLDLKVSVVEDEVYLEK